MPPSSSRGIPDHCTLPPRWARPCWVSMDHVAGAQRPLGSEDVVISRADVCVCHHKRQCLRGAPCINEIMSTTWSPKSMSGEASPMVGADDDTPARARCRPLPVCFCLRRVVLWLATPSPRSLVIGAAIAIARRVDPSLGSRPSRKSKEVTQSGPYRYTRHPLYLGSSLIGIGMAVVANNAIVAAIVDRLSCVDADGGDAQRGGAPSREVRRCVRRLRPEARAEGRAIVQLATGDPQPRTSHHRRTAGRPPASCRQGVFVTRRERHTVRSIE